ncbi:MAG: restriction endonuclease subunit S [Chloroflexi bacterium]|nr:restriction endonuclease subunit S [Chloroflexota bacterium]MCI0646423.1 restriction endonuclease subunit S [Chloroflexota bacterium]MCI0730183.1 restriction endonuclease subunit S [Chloroflexota bacterium]
MTLQIIPDGWQVGKIGDYALLVNSGATPRGGAKSYLSSGVPLIRSQNVLMNQLDLRNVVYISDDTHQDMDRSQVQPGDVLLNITGASIGRVAYVPESVPEANVNQHVCRIRFKKDSIYPPYVAFYLSTHKAQIGILGAQSGSTRQGLTFGQIKMLEIPLPPVEEQKAIAGVLRAVQEAIAARQQEVALEGERKAALMQHLFTHGTRGEPLKDTPIGKVPQGWKAGKLGQIATIVMGQSPPGNTYNTNGSGKPLINGPAEYGSEHPTPVQWTSQPTKICEAGDILFCVRGNTVGRINIADQPYCIGRGVAAIRGKEDESATSFIRYLLEHEATRIYNIATAGGSTFPSITTSQLKSYGVPTPTLDEQNSIADALQACDTKIAALEKEITTLNELFQALLEELMTGRLPARPLVEGVTPAKDDELVAGNGEEYGQWRQPGLLDVRR